MYCNAILNSGTATVNTQCLLNMNGGTNLGGNTVITFRASLWRYHTITNTGIAIASGSQSNTWDTSALGGENNTRKNTAISISIASTVVFLENEILLLQIGCEGTTLPNATLGTTNFDVTLDVDTANTDLQFAANQWIHQACNSLDALTGKGTVTRQFAASVIRTATGKGQAILQKSVTASKTFSLTGKGIVTRTVAIAEDFDLVGKGTVTMNRTVLASVTTTLIGKGTVTRQFNAGIVKTATGIGVAILQKSVTASKTFSLTGKGIVTDTHLVQAYRTFNLIGKGEILVNGPNGSTITIPIDEVPEGGGGTTIEYIFGVIE